MINDVPTRDTNLRISITIEQFALGVLAYQVLYATVFLTGNAIFIFAIMFFVNPNVSKAALGVIMLSFLMNYCVITLWGAISILRARLCSTIVFLFFWVSANGWYAYSMQPLRGYYNLVLCVISVAALIVHRRFHSGTLMSNGAVE